MKHVLEYCAHAQVGQFIQSPSLYTLLLGDRGAGKTTGGLMRILARSKTMDNQLWAVVRDTRKHLGYTVGRTIDHWYPEPHTIWANKKKESPDSCTLFRNAAPVVRFNFFGVEYFNEETDDFFERTAMYDGVWFDDVDQWSFDRKHFVQAIYFIRACTQPSIQITSNVLPVNQWVSQMWKLHEDNWSSHNDLNAEQAYAQAHIREQSAIFRIPDEENAADLLQPGYLARCREVRALLASKDK